TPKKGTKAASRAPKSMSGRLKKPAPSRMASALGMRVQPVVAEMLPGGQGWRVQFLPPWEDFPTSDALADTARINRWIEEQVRQRPEQYFWVHKRFKTRPPGDASLY
ncbi:MAG: hypothetical protein EOO25_15190, partial [Comamonadaceae bacterium]